MFAPTAYLSWAMQFYGNVPYDLATSGMPFVGAAELAPDRALFDDFRVLARMREAIAAYNDVSVEETAPAMGTANAMFLAYAALLSPGDEVLVEHPVYEPLVRCAEGLGARVNHFDRREEEGFDVVPERVAAKVTPRTRAIVVTNLHNPSGVRLRDESVRELCAIADASGAYVVVDEVYAPFANLPEDGVFRASARKLAPNAIATGSLTKCYGFGKHRIGWMLGPPDVVERAQGATLATVGHFPLPYAAYAVEAFTHVPRLATRAKELLGKKRVVAEEWVRALSGARWSAPREGLFGLVTLPGKGDLRPRIESAARDAGVLVAPGCFFGAPESFRLSWASCDEAKLREGLRLLERVAR